MSDPLPAADFSTADLEPRLRLTVFNPEVTGAEPSVVGPAHLEVAQNYPNPFAATTHFRVGLPAAETVVVEVFDLLGRRVTVPYRGRLEAAVDFRARSH